ncbi:MAG: hypothetical protein GF381_03430 [Candidatus Pacebacteria bacterium]|nr:hypothetical protein [Candidatus Paceibacterota bacterium]
MFKLQPHTLDRLKNIFSRPEIQLGLLVVLALVVRLYKITNPILDWHAWRQADTASVTREYVKQGIDLLRPQYHDLSNIPSGQANPQGWRMVELPIINFLVASLLRLVPSLGLAVTSRFISVLFSLGTLLSLYWLAKQISNQKVALLTGLFFSLVPFSIFYSRVVLPEPGVLFFSTLSLASFASYLSSYQPGSWLLSVVSLTIAFLLKPFVAFLSPAYLALILTQNDLKTNLKQKLLWLYPLLPVIPFLAWRQWIKNFSAGIPASDWLFNSDRIRLRPAWFRWLFYERLTKLILGYLGLIFLPFNLRRIDRSFWLTLGWGVGLLLYLIVIATGNVRHDYYQTLLIPGLCFALGRGAYYLHDWLDQKTNLASLIVGLLIAFQLLISWQQVKGYYQVNHGEYQLAGQEADKILPADALVIAPAMGDTQFLFQINRRGWPIGFEIDKKINQGATHYITTSQDSEAKQLKQKYRIVKETQEYLILDLTKERN